MISREIGHISATGRTGKFFVAMSREIIDHMSSVILLVPLSSQLSELSIGK